MDGAATVYVPDLNNNTIRMVTPVGTNWVVTTLAGKAPFAGSADGAGSVARFNGPESVRVDNATNIYVADTGNNTIRKITLVGTNWVVTTIAGTAGALGVLDETNHAARFDSPDGITIDSETNLYVADEAGNTILKITPVGTNWVVTTIAGLGRVSGNADGIGSAARFNGPSAMGIDSATNLYVPDIINNTIRKVTPIGTYWIVTTLVGKALALGSADGIGSVARFNTPNQITVDSAGNLYVADAENSTIREGTPPFLINSFGPSIGLKGEQFGFVLNGLGGQTVVVDASDDLSNWQPIWTNILTFPAPVNFTDLQPDTNAVRFYRARTP